MARALEFRLLLLLTIVAIAVACTSGDENSQRPQTSIEGTRVAFQTEDGKNIDGRVFGAGDTGVILAHMFPSDQTSWHPFAKRLAAEGFIALTFDFRGYGVSDGPLDVPELPLDIRAAIDLLRDHGATDVYLIGASMGGTASVVVAEDGDVAGIVAISAPRDFQGLSASASAPDVTIPALLIASEQDGSAPADAAWLAETIRGPTATRIYPGAAHGTRLLEGEAQAAVEDLLLSFVTDPESTLATRG